MKTAGIFVIATMLLAGPVYAATPLGPPTWGNPDQVWGVRRPVTQADRAAIAVYRSGHVKPIYATNFNDQATLQSQWLFKSDDSSGLKSCRRPANIVATNDGLRLRTLIAADCKAKWSTGSMWSSARYGYGFFEATIKTADINGLNNAFWLTTDDHFEIDAPEIHYPNNVGLSLHNWAGGHDHSVGFKNLFADNFSTAFHDFGVLWTPTDIIYEVDGEPIAAIATNGAVKGTADIRFSTALADFAGKIPEHPEGHDMQVKSLRVYSLSGTGN